MTKRSGLLIILFVVVFGLVVNANAIPILGTPTAADGDMTPVGTVDSDGRIEFYVPLEGDPETSGTYGVDGFGMWPPDNVTVPPAIDGPLMNMYLLFDLSEGYIGHTLTLHFTDLDLRPWNDPYSFKEQLIIRSGGVLPDGTYKSYYDNDLFPHVVSADFNGSILTFADLNIETNLWWLCLGFKAYGGEDGNWTNTPEYLTATLYTNNDVPEPATMLLLGSGLLGLAGLMRRFKRR